MNEECLNGGVNDCENEDGDQRKRRKKEEFTDAKSEYKSCEDFKGFAGTGNCDGLRV